MSEITRQKSTKQISKTELVVEIRDALEEEDFYCWNSRVDRALDTAFQERDALLGLTPLSRRRQND